MKTIDTTAYGAKHYSPLLPAMKAVGETAPGEMVEIVLNDVSAFNELKEYFVEQGIGFREIYEGNKMTLQFVR